jgi:hypothetical protein
VDRADRSAANVRNASRMARRMAACRANVNDIFGLIFACTRYWRSTMTSRHGTSIAVTGSPIAPPTGGIHTGPTDSPDVIFAEHSLGGHASRSRTIRPTSTIQPKGSSP